MMKLPRSIKASFMGEPPERKIGYPMEIKRGLVEWIRDSNIRVSEAHRLMQEQCDHYPGRTALGNWYNKYTDAPEVKKITATKSEIIFRLVALEEAYERLQARVLGEYYGKEE